jgi:hypothetical protein
MIHMLAEFAGSGGDLFDWLDWLGLFAFALIAFGIFAIGAEVRAWWKLRADADQ